MDRVSGFINNVITFHNVANKEGGGNDGWIDGWWWWQLLHSPRPRVTTRNLEAKMPGARELSLTFWSRAYAMTVSLAVFPATAVGASVVEVEPAAVQVLQGRGGPRCRGGCRGGGGSSL